MPRRDRNAGRGVSSPRSRGILVALEGPDGCGKSTQARLLVEDLARAGLLVRHVREPGGTAAAEEIRRILLGRGEGPSMRAESLLYHAARADLYDRVVLPALARNGIVVSERSLYSTLAYQGFGAGEPIPALRDAGLFAVKGRLPDRVILLDLPVQNGLSRIRGAKDRLESRSLEFHRRMRRGFLSLARREPRRFRVVSAAGSVSAVARRVRRALSDVLG